jgi:hypothetical protein
MRGRRREGTVTDLGEALIVAFTAFDKAAAAMGEREKAGRRPGGDRWRPTARTLEREARAKQDALDALGIDGVHAHRTIAAIRHAAPSWLPGGLSVGDAVQTFLNDHYDEGAPRPVRSLRKAS